MSDPTEVLKLTEEERLRFENYTLKLSVIQHEAARQAGVVVSKRMELSKEIGKRLGISMASYTINIETGDVALTKDKPEASNGGGRVSQMSTKRKQPEGRL